MTTREYRVHVATVIVELDDRIVRWREFRLRTNATRAPYIDREIRDLLRDLYDRVRADGIAEGEALKFAACDPCIGLEVVG